MGKSSKKETGTEVMEAASNMEENRKELKQKEKKEKKSEKKADAPADQESTADEAVEKKSKKDKKDKKDKKSKKSKSSEDEMDGGEKSEAEDSDSDKKKSKKEKKKKGKKDQDSEAGKGEEFKSADDSDSNDADSRKRAREDDDESEDEIVVRANPKMQRMAEEAEEVEGGVPVYCGQLAWNTTGDQLREFFDGCGEILKIRFSVGDHGMGFVFFTNEGAAKKAAARDGMQCAGRNIVIKEHTFGKYFNPHCVSLKADANDENSVREQLSGCGTITDITSYPDGNMLITFENEEEADAAVETKEVWIGDISSKVKLATSRFMYGLDQSPRDAQNPRDNRGGFRGGRGGPRGGGRGGRGGFRGGRGGGRF